MPLVEIKKESPLLLRNPQFGSTSPKPIVVIGAGATGSACALAAAAQGADVVLLEQSGCSGGIVVHTLIHTLGGLFDDCGEFMNPGLSIELTERLSRASQYTRKRRIGKTWILNVDPQVYGQVIREWIVEYPNIKVHHNASITNISLHAGSIKEIKVTGSSTFTLSPLVVIDATGYANFIRSVTNVSDLNKGKTLAGVIVRLRKVASDTVKFPKSVALLLRIRRAVKNRELPPECASLWLDDGVYPDEVYVKFNIKLSDYNVAYMEKIAGKLLVFLRNRPEFGRAFIDTIGQLGIRGGCSVKGDYTLTEADMKKGTRFADTVCQACWPIEYWDSEQGVQLGHFPPGHRYDIPLSSLKVHGFNNLFTAGKSFSAVPRAQASARVVGTCWAMGEGLINAIIEEYR